IYIALYFREVRNEIRVARRIAAPRYILLDGCSVQAGTRCGLITGKQRFLFARVIDFHLALHDRNSRTFGAAFDRENCSLNRYERVRRLNIESAIILLSGLDDDIAAIEIDRYATHIL